jgi:hypothetical protein
VKQLSAMVLLAAVSTVAHAQVTCQTSGNTTTCNGSLGGSTISDNGAFNSNLGKISAAQYGPNAVALQQQAAAQAALANQQARLVAQQAEYVRQQTLALQRQQDAAAMQSQQEADTSQMPQQADTAYVIRCNTARVDCLDGEGACKKWRDAFNAQGSVCPAVNAPSSAAMRGPNPTLAATAPNTGNLSSEDTRRCESAASVCAAGDDPTFCMTYKRNFNSEGLSCPGVNAPASPTSSSVPAAATSSASEALAKIQMGCDSPHGDKTFASQIKCIESGIRGSRSLADTDSGNLRLYMLTADKLVDDVSRKQTTVAAARVELQKAYLEFRDRTNQKNRLASSSQ